MNKLKEEVTYLKIAAIAGSNANHSYNRMLLEFMAQHFKDQDQIDVIDIRQVPMFNESFKGDAPEVITLTAGLRMPMPWSSLVLNIITQLPQRWRVLLNGCLTVCTPLLGSQ